MTASDQPGTAPQPAAIAGALGAGSVSAAAAPAPPPGQPAQPAQTTEPSTEPARALPSTYRASGGRRLFFSFAFLLLLPFAASLGPMLFQRITTGQWSGLGGFLVVAVGLLAVTALVAAELIRSIRSEVVLGDDAVRLTLPAGKGPTPLYRYASHDIPYDEIASVETRREVYGGYIAPMLLRGSRLMLKNGGVVRLGYVSEADVDPVFPYPQIAEQIAERAGIAVNDTGNVWRSMPRKMLGLRANAASRDNIDEATVVALNAGHKRFMAIVIAGLALLVAAGIASDYLAGSEGRPLPGIGLKR